MPCPERTNTRTLRLAQRQTLAPQAYEAGLQDLLEIIQSLRPPSSPGLTSFGDSDPDQDPLLAACLELERRGKIRRTQEEGALVIWASVEAPQPQ